MKNIITNRYDLVTYLNQAKMDSTNDEIAQYLYEHPEMIRNASLREMSEKSYFSQSGFSRFLKQNGAESYQQFRNMYMEFEGYFPHALSSMGKRFEGMDTPQLISATIREQMENVDAVSKLPPEVIEEVLSIIHKYKRIIFVGSDFSMAIMAAFEQAIMMDHKLCYCLTNPIGQTNMTARLKEEDLVIVISIKQRWYSWKSSEETIHNILSSKAYKMLWTPENTHKDEDRFDYVFRFGHHINDLSYTQLSVLSSILTPLYINRYCNQ